MSEKRDLILQKYLKVCVEASENEEYFSTFKSNVDYKEVLEHLSYELGLEHLNLISKNNPNLLEVGNFFDNDLYGSPETYFYGNKRISPTTLQYISVLSNLIDLYASLDSFQIVEIGAGYGGQCKIINDYFSTKYTLIDFEECSSLQKKYLSNFSFANDFEFFNPENFPTKTWNLVISNYALSEVSEEDQLDYVEKICLNSDHGYITANQPLNGIELIKEKFSETFKISKDISGERNTNYLITW